MIITQYAEEITEWFVVFQTATASGFLDRIIPGKFKHVCAFGWSAGCQVWVFFDPAQRMLHASVAPAGKLGDEAVSRFIHYRGRESSVLKMARQAGRGRSHFMRGGFWCTSTIAHLLNMPGGALLPDRLWRDCINANAKIVIDGLRRTSASADA